MSKSKISVSLDTIVVQMAEQVGREEGFKTLSSFVNECVKQYCGNLGYEIVPAKVIKRDK